MSAPMEISLKNELLFIKSLLIPAFDPDYELDTSKKRKEWMRQRANNTNWDASISAELIIRYGTVNSLEKAESLLEKAERLLEKAEENERKKGGAEAAHPIHDLIMLEHEKQKTLTIQKSLVTLKAGMLTKRISARNTETITTPVEPADRPPFVDMLVVGMSALDFEEGAEEPHISTSPEDSILFTSYSSPALFPELKADEHWSAKEKEDCKRYVELLRSVVDVRGMKIALYPAGCPTTVNILYGRDQSRELCHFCPSATFNAYSYLAKVCDADANVLVKNIEDKVVVNCKDYYAEKFSNKPGTGTPPYKVPR